jgi:molybdate transport system permease protein
VDWTALRVTLCLAGCTTAILFIVGVPLAHWLATTRWRGHFLVEALVTLPLVLPPTVLGFYLLLALGPHSPVGPARLAFSFPGILVGSLVANLPFAVRPFTSAFASVDRRLVEASWCLGVSRWGTFRRVILPLAWPGILTGVILTFAHALGEFGVVLMIGGNIPGVTRTLSIAIYDDVNALKYKAAEQMAGSLVLFAFVALCITYALQRRVRPL